MGVAVRLTGAVLALILCLTCAFFSFAARAQADGETVSTQELIENAEEFDGREVVIEGEVVGDIMNRGTHAWITVDDDSYSDLSLEEGGDFTGISNYGMGVWLPADEAEKIRVLGGYKHKGDRVRVEGVFHRADTENGGDMDIHGTYLQVLEPGYPFAHPFAWWKLVLLLVLFSVLSLLGTVWWKRTRPS
jgi:hypothetical protein